MTAESALLGLLSGVGGWSWRSRGSGLNRFAHGFALDLRPWLIAVSLAGALAIALLSGLYPAWRARG